MNPADHDTRNDIPIRDFAQSLPMALLRAREAMMVIVRPNLAKVGVTEPQWRVLRALATSDEPLMARAVSERTLLLGPSLTRLVATLAERGLVRSEADAGDGRKVQLSLTPEGRELVRQIVPISESIYVWVENQFGADRVKELTALLNELAALSHPKLVAPLPDLV